MRTLRGLFFLLVLPIHTAVLAGVAIVVSLVSPQGGDAVLGLGRLWSRILLWLAGVRLRVRGAERLAGGPYVILSNHQSLFDIPALILCLDDRFRIVAKKELFWIPFFGWAMGAAGFVSVDRADRGRAIASLSRAARRVRDGCSVVVFAEGTRSDTGELQPLKKGAFHLAQEAGVALLPITVSGSRAVLPKGAALPRPGSIDVVVGRPLAPAAGSVEETAVRRAEAALREGYTDRHREDLAARRRSPGPRGFPGMTL